MNEITLNALINLFALFSAINQSKKEEAIRNFSLYLHQHLGISDTQDYLQLFEELLDLYGIDGAPAFAVDLLEQASKISTNIRSWLRKDEQVMVLIRLLELVKSGNRSKAKVLFDTLAHVFEISPSQVDQFIAFIDYPSTNQVNSPDFLIIDSNTRDSAGRRNRPAEYKYRHLYEKNMDGELLFLRSSLIANYLFIFHGREYLTIEGNPIIPGRFYAFREGNIIRGPRISPVYFVDIASAFIDQDLSPSFVFSGEEIEYHFKKNDNGLHPFSFSEKSGQLIAIMGGSGVGKSTLLNILNGNIPVHHGNIRINQVDIYQQKKEIEGLIGSVPQDDLLLEELTVWENLYFSASLSFGQLSRSALAQKVERILQELELDSLKNLKVGSPLNKMISGGQRKRLNVALELVREPALLFADEPTSGLSSTDSEKVMLLLKQQTRKGKLLIVNIHQPSSVIFKLFDQLWVMDTGGRIIYTGNPLDAIIYFKTAVNQVNAQMSECVTCGNVNPEQVLEMIETKKIDHSGNFLPERRFTPEYWYGLYRKNAEEKKFQVSSSKFQVRADRSATLNLEPGTWNLKPRTWNLKPETWNLKPGTWNLKPGTWNLKPGTLKLAPSNSGGSLPPRNSKTPGLIKQFRIFFERNLRTKLSDRPSLFINLLISPVLAVIVAWFTRYSEGDTYVFFENKSFISSLFMAVVVVMLVGMSVSAEEIIKDRKILARESFLHLSRFSYLNSKVWLLILLSAIQTFSFVLIVHLVLEIHDGLLANWLILFSLSVFSNLLGLNISAAFDSVVAIYIIIPLLLIPQILLCGVIVKFDDLQSHTAEKDVVPLAGEMMASRWAFEAMAVNQFKENRYMARFFDLEQQIAQARFRSEILITELIGQVDLVAGSTRKETQRADFFGPLSTIARKLPIIQNEIKKLDAEKVQPPFQFTQRLVTGKFNDTIAQLTKNHLHQLKNFYNKRAQNAQSRKDHLINQLNKTKGDHFLSGQKMKFHNKSLEMLVLNAETSPFYRLTPYGYIQKIASIYKDPDPDFTNGRAHFLASHKNLFGYSVHTFTFNLGVMWLMSTFLYLALYYNWLRKMLSIPAQLYSGWLPGNNN